ncbi:MAG TPA: M3 family metallopeptidase [Methanospirillum sp.]|uniref:M3 family metallopeptidase n=1 Tax=Methanospirillum sp. TaxID=45200 RepID=UPI002CDCA0C1|nr:M3 family metallopeptidase [Methanospirillum sp.]HWQ63814.1 M3 family metallopeptidase [Methanospirillum sp.]
MGRKVILTGVVILFLVLIAIPVIWIPGNQNPIYTWHISPDIGDPVQLTYLPGEIPVEINRTITETTRKLDDLTAIPDTSRTFTNTDVRLDAILADFDEQTLKYSLIADVTGDLAVKKEAEYASYQRDEFFNSVYLREDIAHALSMVTPDQKVDSELHDRLTEDFRLASLPAEVKNEMSILGRNLSERCSVYYANQQDGNASLNLPLIPDIISMRQQITALIGYNSFVDYQIAQSGVPVDRAKLLSYLTNKSVPYSQASHKEATELLQEKQKSNPGATAVYDYEIPLLRSKVNQTNVSTVSCSTTVSADLVVKRLNNLVADLFGISITPVPSSVPSGMYLYRITDPGSLNTQAWYYLWIKTYPGAGSTTGKTYYLRAGHESDGIWIPPVSALIISVPEREEIGKISLSPVDIQVLFHEYGHLLRHSLTTGRYATLSSGARDPRGYSEVFSLFFEKFLWTPEVLDRLGVTGTQEDQYSSIHDQILACHGEDAGWGPGYIGVYPYFLSLLDLEIHSENVTPDFINQYNSLYENMTGYRAASGPSSLILNPAFFVSDNAGIYWHYVFDETCANNIFSRIQGEGVLNQSNGIIIRRELFEPAGSVNISTLIADYLGTSDLLGICS